MKRYQPLVAIQRRRDGRFWTGEPDPVRRDDAWTDSVTLAAVLPPSRYAAKLEVHSLNPADYRHFSVAPVSATNVFDLVDDLALMLARIVSEPMTPILQNEVDRMLERHQNLKGITGDNS